MNEKTTLDDYKKKIKSLLEKLDKAYSKMYSINKMPIFYVDKKEKYTIGEIVPYKLLKDKNVDTIYRYVIDKNTHILYSSNIILYNNLNQTLPEGIDEKTNAILETSSNKEVSTKNINILVEKDLFEVEIRSIKIIDEE